MNIKYTFLCALKNKNTQKLVLIHNIFMKGNMVYAVYLYLITVGTHSMLAFFEVNGEATEASASDSEIPAWAVLSAPQSFAPSPHIPTQYLK